MAGMKKVTATIKELLSHIDALEGSNFTGQIKLTYEAGEIVNMSIEIDRSLRPLRSYNIPLTETRHDGTAVNLTDGD